MFKRKRTVVLVILLTVIALFAVSIQTLAVPVQSEDQKVNIPQYQEPQKAETPSIFWMMIQLVLALGLIVLMAWGLIHLLGSKMGSRLQGQWIRVLDEVMLGQNRGIVALEIGGRVFLAGVTDHQISMLLEIEDQQMIEDMVAAGSESTRFSSDNWNVLNAWVDKFKQQVWPQSEVKPNEFSNVMSDKVRKLERLANRVNGGEGVDAGNKGDGNE
ncbi:MAG: FliO/MopB family protein [Candidatus Saccharibacteria bacterium]